MISTTFIFNLLLKHSKYWYDEKNKTNYILDRGRLSGNERKQLNLEAFTSLAFEFYSKEVLKEILKTYRSDFRAYRIRGSQKPKNGGGYWPNFYTFIKVLVAGEENLGPQEKAVNLKFNPLLDTSFLSEGFLIVEKCKSKQPKIYEIKEENGVKKYPYIWIDEIYSFEADEIPEQED